MQNQIISLETAKLAKEKGFMIFEQYWYRDSGVLEEMDYIGDESLSDYISLEINSTDIVDYENGFYFASSQSLLQKWLREMHKIEVSIIPAYDSIIPKVFDMSKIKWKNEKAEYFCFVNDNTEEATDDDIDDFMCFHVTYEEALEEGLQKGLNLIK